MKVNKIVSAAFVMAVLVSACAAPPAPAPAAPTTEAPADATKSGEQAPAASGEQITLQVWDFGGEEFEWMESIAIPEFQKKYPNIKVEHLGVPESDYATKLDTAIAGNKAPDIALQSYQYKLWKAGKVLTLDDYMARDGFKPEDFLPIFKSWNMLDGKTYAMPVNAYVWAMAYNKDLFKAAGLPELAPDSVITYDDWLAYARAINKASDKLEDRVWGSAHFVPSWNAMNNYMSEPYVLGPDGKQCETSSQTEDWLRTWQNMATAHSEGLTPETSSAMLGQLSSMDLMKQGKLGMTYATGGDALAYKDAGLNVGLVGQPVVSEKWQGNAGSWDDAYAIMASSQHPDEAWLFLKFLTTEVADMRSKAVGGNPPAYLPLAKGWAGDDPLKQATFTLLQRVVPPPFNPDIWTAVGPYDEAWRRMTEDKTDVKTAVADAAKECQEKLTELWTTWDSLGQ